MKKYIFAIILTVFMVSGSHGYGAVEVFVSIPPQKWLVDMVGKDLVNVGILVKEGQNPHTFEPSPRQLAALSRAKVWFVMGMEFEAQLVRRVRAVAPELQVIDITQGIKKIPITDEGHEHGGDDLVDDHDGEELDPHVWLSPVNLQLMGQVVAETLVHLDSVHAAAYRQNQTGMQQQLDELHQQLTRQLQPYRGAYFYVFHPSFGYFAKAYSLIQEPVEAGGKSPSPRQLAKLISRAKAEKVKVIFVQPQFDPKSAQAVASAIGGKVVPLDSLAEDVLANMQMMATKIEAALIE